MTVLHLLTYASVAIFIVAIAVRAIRLATTPVHLRWELYPVAHEKDRVQYGGSYFEEVDWWTKPRKSSMIGELKVMIPEILLLKGVWEHNRALWWWSFPLHFGLYLVIGLAALVVIGAIVGTETAIGGIIGQVGWIIGWVGYILGAFGAVGLFFKRLGQRQLRDFTPPAAYFNLVFLFALFVSGIYLFGTTEYPHVALAGFAQELFTFSPGPAVSGAAAVHVTIAVLFMLYLPFTHMTHFMAKYFTYHSVRWNDEPNLPGSKLEKTIQHQLTYPVSWSAPHLKADGKKNWADIATDTEVD